MSLFGGADCSAAANPLAQFSKHTAEDRSLQRSNFNNVARAGSGMRTETQMNQNDQLRMNNFLKAKDNFNFNPMRSELHHLNHQQPSLKQSHPSSNWSSEFNPIQKNEIRTNSWGSEFQGSSPLSQNAPLIQTPHSQEQMAPNAILRSRIGGYNPMFSGYSNNLLNRGIQPLATNARVTEVQDGKWEDHFKEIDEQLSKKEGKLSEEEVINAENEPEIMIDDKYQANFDEVWESLHSEAVEHEFSNTDASWEKDFATYAQTRHNFGSYQFEDQNQFSNIPNAYEIGLTLMANGAKLSEAALAFEAAVQEDPNHVNAWLKLGEVQTQNEKETAGLTALEKCLSLDPGNLNALMTLAVSYINEGYDNAAFATLERWIETKYPQVTNAARTTNPKINDEDRYSLNKRVTELFIQAAQLSPTGANIDADVQMGLGALFYANEEYDKTIDCFKAALSVRPDDALLWNRLGASLANSSRSEEAIEAYYRALQLKPTFVRARYNLGVSSINIGCYKEAAEHLLAALSMHKVEGVGESQNFELSLSNQSTTIIETLKRAFLAMDRRDLVEKVKPHMDLDQFRGEFNF